MIYASAGSLPGMIYGFLAYDLRNQPMPTIPATFDIAAAAPRIREWATRAAISYGTYSGINAAIKDAKDKSLRAVHTADAFRNEMIVLTVIRVFALLDRDAKVSLQAVNRFLTQEDAFDRVLDAYSAGDPPHLRLLAEQSCRTAINSFRSSFGEIDWQIHGRLQAFRNGAIAHISLSDVQALLTYRQLEHFVRLCARMSADVSMMTSGLNDDPEDRLRDASDDANRFWNGVFEAELRNTVAGSSMAP